MYATQSLVDASEALAPRGRPAFLRTPAALRVWVAGAIAAAMILPVVLAGTAPVAHPVLLTAVVVVVLSVLNVEIGRLLEGGVAFSQRPHKALSAWAFAAALVSPLWTLLPVVALVYAHAWWRGMRVTPWKWVGSAAYVVLAGLAAGLVSHPLLQRDPNLMAGNGGRGLVAVLLGAATFLVVETVLFHGSAYLNHRDDELWLRETLASPSFYLTEAGVLLVGGLSAAIWTGGAWFVVLLSPIYALAQRAALTEPLRQRADHDDKTGALRFESFRQAAVGCAERARRRGQSSCLVFVDIDHFKQFNDTWGHLAGDEALVAVTEVIRRELRSHDLLGRFGGEEFCVFLPGVDTREGRSVAERIRTAVGSAVIGETDGLTISIGVAALPPSREPVELAPVLLAADRALFTAKAQGRDRTVLVTMGQQADS